MFLLEMFLNEPGLTKVLQMPGIRHFSLLCSIFFYYCYTMIFLYRLLTLTKYNHFRVTVVSLYHVKANFGAFNAKSELYDMHMEFETMLFAYVRLLSEVL